MLQKISCLCDGFYAILSVNCPQLPAIARLTPQKILYFLPLSEVLIRIKLNQGNH